MTESCGKYSEKQISRFIDQALPRQEIEQIRHHLDACSTCRNLAVQFRKAAKTFDELVEPSGLVIDPDRLYQSMQHSAEKSGGSRGGIFFGPRFRRFIPFRPMLAAASAAVLLVIGGITLMNNGISPDSPSAIVTSIDTEYTAVMIFETPDTHHTIIWYSET
ncbi:MAG: zf-HC2 domain-containing protein [Desulfotignum sp.]|nr:zf-HC2 domain-containing protein [Desulfotignum sp.]